MNLIPKPKDIADWNRLSQGKFPGFLDIEVVKMSEAEGFEIEMPVTEKIFAPNGFIHGGAITAFADTACGFGCRATLPQGSIGYTTIELKLNFMRTAKEGRLRAVAHCLHSGRKTQVWTAEIWDKSRDKRMAHFQCTQMILWP